MRGGIEHTAIYHIQKEEERTMGTDSLYYIKDYGGNYYKVNAVDQLVAATSKTEAAVFTLSQATSRLGFGKKSTFYYMTPTDGESKRDTDLPAETGEEDERMVSVKDLTYDELHDPVEKKLFSYDLSEMDWADYLTHFSYVASGISAYREELTKKESDLDKKVCDILHYIELCEIDDEAAIDLMELLRVCRENRREIKDELLRTEYFQNYFGNSANVSKAKQALKSIQGLETRQYKPRKYEELFENCTLKTRRTKKEDLDVSENYTRVRTKHEERENDHMTEERIYTPYDGKENDWLSFARQQAEFYRNAGQFIFNLQMEITEIDHEIEEILRETEDANCNVAQGYKVFKRLKMLRLEKKAKEQELNCLYILTDYIDCEAMADACEGNLAEIKVMLHVEDDVSEQGAQYGEDEEEQICMVNRVQEMVG